MNAQTRKKHTPRAVGIRANGMEISSQSRVARRADARRAFERPTCLQRTPCALVGTPCLKYGIDQPAVRSESRLALPVNSAQAA